MKFKSIVTALFALAFSIGQAFGQASILPPGETCFSALAPTSGGPGNTGTGFIGLLGSITGGTGYTNGTYGGVALTGGSGTNATANIVVSGGVVTQVSILNPGLNYVVGDILSAASATIGGTGSGFSVGISSISINFALAGGSIAFYIPNTLSIKQTWQDSGETTLNTNPVALDANGCAVIYGAGIYRSILKDSLGNTVWDKLTASSSSGGSGIFWAGLAGGTGNAITITDSAFANLDNSPIQFLAKLANTGPTTIAVSGGTPIAVVIDTSSGPAALSGGEIGIGNTPIVTYDATNVEFHLVNPSAATSSSGGSAGLTAPQGYLNLVGQATGDVVQTGDVVSATTVFYSPFYGGNTLPIWNGAVFKTVTFSELTTTLTAAGSPLNAIQDNCVFSNNGVPTLVTGPSWTTATAGAGNRGTGAGTPQLTRLQGIWVNAVAIIGYNGLSSFNIAANQCTYVGSLSIDATAGQVSAYRTFGQARKFGIWNAYNRKPIVLQAGTTTSAWTNAPTTWRQSFADANNFAMAFSGLPEEIVDAAFTQNITVTAATGNSTISNIGIGVNVTNSPTGMFGVVQTDQSGATLVRTSGTAKATAVIAPFIGLNQINMIEQAPAGTTNNQFNGLVGNNLLKLNWQG